MAVDSELKLFYHLTEKLVTREIRTFAELVEYAKNLSNTIDPTKTVVKAFGILKELYWGFFKEMDKSTYARLWKELVVPSSAIPGTGDLKRNMSISNIYISMMDIHGYTRFCQESKSNLSRLRKLDEFLHDGIKRIASKNKTIANRERGDEIVVVGASATDIIKTTLEIINTFAKRSVIKNEAVQRSRADYSIVLPDFKVTAGIAGGNLTTPLIITESGLLSGFLLNTAARLQGLANEYSPKESKIMITNSVYSNFWKENKVVKSDLYTRKLIHFFNNGIVNFKGTKVSSYEIIFREQDTHRLKYEQQMIELYESLKQDLWKHKVFKDLTSLIIHVCRYMPSFSIEIQSDQGIQVLSNASLSKLCDQAAQTYDKENYIAAVEQLGLIVEQVDYIPDFERLIINYASEVYARYCALNRSFEQRLEEEIEKKIDAIFTSQYKSAYRSAQKNAGIYRKLKNYALKSPVLSNRKIIWYTLIQENLDDMKLEIYSGKK